MATKKQSKRKCHGRTVKGTPCRATPLRKGTEIGGVKVKGKHCRRHDPDIPDSARFGTKEQAKAAGDMGGRPRKPRPDDVLRQRIEENIDRWLQPLEDALGQGKPVQMWDGDERKHHIEFVPDPALAMKAMKFAFERVYGKPRQAIDLAGADGGTLQVSHVFEDDELREEMHGLVGRVAAARADKPGGAGSGG